MWTHFHTLCYFKEAIPHQNGTKHATVVLYLSRPPGGPNECWINKAWAGGLDLETLGKVKDLTLGSMVQLYFMCNIFSLLLSNHL